MHVVIAHIPSYVIHDLKPRGRFLMCISVLKKTRRKRVKRLHSGTTSDKLILKFYEKLVI